MYQTNNKSIYIVEVGYNKIYKKTLKQQIDLLMSYEKPNKFYNTWTRKLYNTVRNLIVKLPVVRSIGEAAIYTIPTFVMFGPSKELFAIFLMVNFYHTLPTLINSGILHTIIPIAQPNQHTDGVLFITGNNQTPYHPNGKNNTKSKSKNNNEIEIEIDFKHMDPIIDNIAHNYEARPMDKYTQNVSNVSKEGVFRILNYVFDSPDQNAKNIKKFLYSLPVNVFVKHIHKLEIGESNNTMQKARNTNSDFSIIYPNQNQKQKFTTDDAKIFEYATIHTTNYNKINDNVKFLADYIKPLRYFKRFFPGLFPHQFSPISGLK